MLFCINGNIIGMDCCQFSGWIQFLRPRIATDRLEMKTTIQGSTCVSRRLQIAGCWA